MQIGKQYKTKQGETIRTPLKFSQCGRYVKALVEFKNNKAIEKWYFINARQFEVLVQ